MKITVGEWKTRDGSKAIVAASNAGAHPMYYWIGWIYSAESKHARWINGQSSSWDESGRFIGDEEDDDCDIVAQWIDPVPWDWSTTPPWIDWIARDEAGIWYLCDMEPSLIGKSWDLFGGVFHVIPSHYYPKWSGDWRKSKTMRPGFNGGAK